MKIIYTAEELDALVKSIYKIVDLSYISDNYGKSWARYLAEKLIQLEYYEEDPPIYRILRFMSQITNISYEPLRYKLELVHAFLYKGVEAHSIISPQGITEYSFQIPDRNIKGRICSKSALNTIPISYTGIILYGENKTIFIDMRNTDWAFSTVKFRRDLVKSLSESEGLKRMMVLEDVELDECRCNDFKDIREMVDRSTKLFFNDYITSARWNLVRHVNHFKPGSYDLLP